MSTNGTSVRLFLLHICLVTTAFSQSLAADGTEHIVRIVSDYEKLRMAFEPEYLKIEPGDQVTWINMADEEHDVISFPDGYPRNAGGFKSQTMTRAGERFSHKFDVPGTYKYHCVPHLPMGMRGQIVVGRASAHDEFHVPTKGEIEVYKKIMLEWFDSEEIEMLQQDEKS